MDRQTDRQTDGQNYDFLDLASIAVSRGNKIKDGRRRPSQKPLNFNVSAMLQPFS